MIFKYKTILSFLLFVFMIEMAYAQSEKKDSLDNKNENIQTYGYNYSLPEWMVTNSVSSISSSNINNSFTTNFGNKLHGQIPGLTVSQTRNEPGLDTPNLYSRGIGTFGAKDMLIIIDGFESFYEQLISEEVESVTLLKDAAATSMYGMRGANGVLIISTKRGQQGPLKVEFSAQTGFESPYRLPNFLDSYDYARLYNEALVNDGLPMAYSEDEIDAYRSGGDPYIYPNVDWQEKLLRNSAPVSKYNLTFSGGKNKVNYFVLLSAMNRSGLYEKTEDLSEYSINSKFTQYNIRTNVDIDITDRLIASLNLGFTIEDKKNPGGYSTNSIFNLMSSIPPNAFPIYNPNGTYGGNSKFTNPWGDILESGFFTSNYRTSQSSLKLKHELDMIAEGLSITAAASFNNAFRGYSSKSRDYERYSISRDTLNNYSYRKFGEITSLSASENQFDQWRNMAFQAFLNYEKSFNGNFIDATLGYDMNSYTLQWEKTDFRHLGLNGRISYAHQKKYIGELSLGYYGANGFPKEKRFGFFPAASLGWILSNEDFLQKNNVLTYLKFRTSYGISGNNLIGNQRFMYDQYYSHQGSYIYGTTSVGGYAEAHLANPDLTWEKKREINVGFDMNLLNNINVNFDVFKQFRYDILAEPQSQIPAYTGILLPQWNVGKVENKGFEAQVGYKSSRSGDFIFFANLNVWYAKNKITNIPEIIKQEDYQLREGKPVNQPFLLEAIGFFKDDEDIANSPTQIFDAVQPGDLKYKDQNNDDIIDERDFYPIGYTNIPELTFGLNSGIQFKDFYLDLFFQGVTNRSVYLSGKNFHAFQDNGKISAIALGRWTESTHNMATYPRLSAQDNMNNFQGSSFWQRDGSFLKLRNAEFGMNLPQSFANKIGIAKAKIFINGTNILTFDHIDIADPEILTGYPATKTLSIGLKVQL